MEVVVLGSGTIAPNKNRTASAYWVTAGNVRLLLDCGPGMLYRAATFDIPWHEVSHVAITHFHPDHWSELPALLFALRWGIEPPRIEPLSLIGPSGFRRRLNLLAAPLGDWVLEPGYPLRITEIEPGTSEMLDDSTAIEACSTPHTDESLAYAVRDKDVRFVYTGDTGPSEALAEWAAECSLLLAECSLPDDRAIDIHLTPSRAGALGRAARTKHLVLTHFYPVFGDSNPAEIAAREFGGPVTAAHDGDRFTVGK